MPRRTAQVLLILLLAGANAQAQGVILPGSTPQGDYLRGVGVAGWGMGLYNLNSAQANQINTETFIRFNEYVDAVVRTQAKELAERRAARRTEYNELHKRRLENPESIDVLKGDALNDVLRQLNDPKISPSSFRSAAVTVPADIIRQIPFMLAEDKTRFSMNRLTLNGKGKWPVAFQDPRFAIFLRSYQDKLDIALEQAINAKLTKEAIADVKAAVNALWRKLNTEFPPGQDPRYIEAKIRLEELDATVELLKKHRVELAIGELEQYAGTTIDDLRLFMQRHGLQFAPATTPDEKTLYPKLHAFLIEQREKLGGAIDFQPK